jgi:hypothetical protein
VCGRFQVFQVLHRTIVFPVCLQHRQATSNGEKDTFHRRLPFLVVAAISSTTKSVIGNIFLNHQHILNFHCQRALVDGDSPPLARLNLGLRQGVFLKRLALRISLRVFTASLTHVTASAFTP